MLVRWYNSPNRATRSSPILFPIFERRSHRRMPPTQRESGAIRGSPRFHRHAVGLPCVGRSLSDSERNYCQLSVPYSATLSAVIRKVGTG